MTDTNVSSILTQVTLGRTVFFSAQSSKTPWLTALRTEKNAPTRKEGREPVPFAFVHSFICSLAREGQMCYLRENKWMYTAQREEMREQDKLLIELVANVQNVERPNRCACCDSIYPKYPCDSLLILLVMFWVLWFIFSGFWKSPLNASVLS